jgi:hypothetical protein
MRKLTATVTVRTDDGKTYAIAFVDGNVAAAASPLPNDSVTRVALTNHFLSPMQVGEITRRLAIEKHRDEVDIVADAGRLSPENTAVLRKRLLIQRAARTFSVDRGEFDIEDSLLLHVIPNFSVPLAAVIFQGIRMNLSEQRLAEDLRELGANYILRPTTTDEDVKRLDFEGNLKGVIAALRKGTTLAELEATQRDIEPRALHALLCTLVCSSLADSAGGQHVDRTAPPAPRTSTGLVGSLAKQTIVVDQPLVTRAKTTSTASPMNMPRTVSGSPAAPRTATNPAFPTRSAVSSTMPPIRETSLLDPEPRPHTPTTAPPMAEPRPITPSRTQTPTATPRTQSPTLTPSRTQTPTASPALTPSRTQTPTASPFPSRTQTPTAPVPDLAMGTPRANVTGKHPALDVPRTQTPSTPPATTSGPHPALDVPRTQTPTHTQTPRTQTPTASPPRAGSPTSVVPSRTQTPTASPRIGTGPLPRMGTQPPRTSTPTSSPLEEFIREASTNRSNPLQPLDDFSRETTTSRGILSRTITAPRTITERDRARREIEALIALRLDKLDKNADYFAMLGVPFEAPQEAVRAAFVETSRKLHPESLSKLGIVEDGDVKGAARIMAQIQAGYAALSDAQKRREYTSAIRRGEATPIAPRARAGELDKKELAAEAFEAGESALKRDDMMRAVEELGKAVQLVPTNLMYTSLFAWAQFCAAADKKAIYLETRKALEKAVHRLDNPVPARFYLGRVERMVGHDREAMNHFELVLLDEPNHKEAQSEVRALVQRMRTTKPKR